MGDLSILGWLLVVSIVVGVVGLVIATSMLRESQRLTRAVAAMVYQEGEKIRATMPPSPVALLLEPSFSRALAPRYRYTD